MDKKARNDGAAGFTADRKVAFGVPIFGMLGMLGLSFSTPGVGLIWNASSSVRRGLYLVLPAVNLDRGDMVAANAPLSARRFAAERHYLPSNVPLIKHVSALPGELLCATGQAVMVDGRRVAARRLRDPKGRLLPAFSGCHQLARTQYLLLGDSRLSFDGRYFGASEKRDIIGRATLLWGR